MIFWPNVDQALLLCVCLTSIINVLGFSICLTRLGTLNNKLRCLGQLSTCCIAVFRVLSLSLKGNSETLVPIYIYNRQRNGKKKQKK